MLSQISIIAVSTIRGCIPLSGDKLPSVDVDVDVDAGSKLPARGMDHHASSARRRQYSYNPAQAPTTVYSLSALSHIYHQTPLPKLDLSPRSQQVTPYIP
jgi:hypothetical protein